MVANHRPEIDFSTWLQATLAESARGSLPDNAGGR
jgi:hypothetical protein